MRTPQAAMDKIAIGLSFGCSFHCLVLPVLIVMLPNFPLAFIGDEKFHQLMLWLVIPCSCVALFLGCKKHKAWKVSIFGASGLFLLIFAVLFGHDVAGEAGEKVLTLAGSFLVAYSHFINHKLCKKADCCS